MSSGAGSRHADVDADAPTWRRRRVCAEVHGLQLSEYQNLNGMVGEVLGRDSVHADRWVVGLPIGDAPFLSKNLRVAEVQWCIGNHKMVLSDKDDDEYSTGWACDDCCSLSDGTPHRWYCPTCEQDTCFSCLPCVGASLEGLLTERFDFFYAPLRSPGEESVSTPAVGALDVDSDAGTTREQLLAHNAELNRTLLKTRRKLELQQSLCSEMREQQRQLQSGCNAMEQKLQELLDYRRRHETDAAAAASAAASPGGAARALLRFNVDAAHAAAEKALRAAECEEFWDDVTGPLQACLVALRTVQDDVVKGTAFSGLVDDAVSTHARAQQHVRKKRLVALAHEVEAAAGDMRRGATAPPRSHRERADVLDACAKRALREIDLAFGKDTDRMTSAAAVAAAAASPDARGRSRSPLRASRSPERTNLGAATAPIPKVPSLLMKTAGALHQPASSPGGRRVKGGGGGGGGGGVMTPRRGLSPRQSSVLFSRSSDRSPSPLRGASTPRVRGGGGGGVGGSSGTRGVPRKPSIT